MARNTGLKEVKKIKSLLRGKHIPFKKLIVFGSYAKMLDHPKSDIDICLVFANKEGDVEPYRRKASIFLNLQGFDVDVFATTAKEFRTNKISPILHEIRKYGIEV